MGEIKLGERHRARQVSGCLVCERPKRHKIVVRLAVSLEVLGWSSDEEGREGAGTFQSHLECWYKLTSLESIHRGFVIEVRSMHQVTPRGRVVGIGRLVGSNAIVMCVSFETHDDGHEQEMCRMRCWMVYREELLNLSSRGPGPHHDSVSSCSFARP
jgi:hypothetical protein